MAVRRGAGRDGGPDRVASCVAMTYELWQGVREGCVMSAWGVRGGRGGVCEGCVRGRGWEGDGKGRGV